MESEIHSPTQLNLIKILKDLTGTPTEYIPSSDLTLSDEKKIFYPIMEFYQYEIKNHPKKSKISHELDSFHGITDSDNDCSNYNMDPKTDSDDNKLSSCDIIMNLTEKNTLDTIINSYYKYLYLLYRKAQLKDYKLEKTLDPVNNFDDMILPYTLINNLIEEYKKIHKKFLEINNLIKKEKFKYIKKITCTNLEQFIIMGDFHGSIHTFIRLLFRFHKYGILNITTMTVNKPYNLVFLGDVVDRGLWGVEIITTLLILLIKNPDSVHFNCGNHEDLKLNRKMGFYKEIKIKYRKHKYKNIFNDFNKLFSLLSSAIIIENVESDKKFWLSHGGIPQKLDFNEVPIDSDPPYNSIFISFNSQTNNYSLDDSDFHKNGIYVIDDDLDTAIRWGDFPYFNHCPSRGIETLKCNTFEYFNSFLKKYSFDGIIRGHQDSMSNSVIFKRNQPSEILNLKTNKNNVENKLEYNPNKSKTNRTKGPIARLYLEQNENSDLQPVVTLSTNTDLGRGLTGDGFGLLKFIENLNQMNNFNQNILTSKKDVEQISLNSEFKKYSIKYLI